MAWKQLSEAPRGLSFHAETGTISGTPVEGGVLRVELSGRDGPIGELDVQLSLRDSCWLAHVSRSEPAAAPQLHVRDTFLTHDIVLGEGESVLDFHFSPDGHWLAYRAGEPARERVFLYALPSGSSAPVAAPLLVPFDCSPNEPAMSCGVRDYAWSPDSKRLAVVLSGAGRDYVSGVDSEQPTAPWPPVGSAAWRDVQVDLQFSGQLTWGGDDWFGFWGLEEGVPASDWQVFHHAFVADPGLVSVSALMSQFGVEPSLRAVPSGLALAYADTNVITSVTRSGEAPGLEPRPLRGVLSPSGELVGFASDEGRLQLSELGTDRAVVESARDSCQDILAWSAPIEPGRVERILCTSGASLRVIDYEPAGSDAAADGPHLAPVDGRAVSAARNLLTTRRMFSPSGRFLLLADAEGGRFSLLDLFADSVDDGLPFLLPAENAFAPTRDAIALADTQNFVEYSLPRSLGLSRAYATSGGAGPAIGALCEESFWRDPQRWCGAPHSDNHWLYSPRSEGLLLEGPAGSLSFADLSMRPQRNATTLPGTLSECPSPCKAKPYAFRPPRVE